MINFNAFLLENFVWALIKDKNVYNGILSKQNNSLRKKSREPGILFFPPNYTKNRIVGDFLDTPHPKDEMPTIHIHSLRPFKSRVQLINTEKSEWYGIKGKDIRTFPFGIIIRGTGFYS